MFRSRRARRDDVWEGVVTGRSRGMLDGSTMYHFVEVRLADGGSARFRIRRRLWKEIAVGDRIVKRAGTDPARG